MFGHLKVSICHQITNQVPGNNQIENHHHLSNWVKCPNPVSVCRWAQPWINQMIISRISQCWTCSLSHSCKPKVLILTIPTIISEKGCMDSVSTNERVYWWIIDQSEAWKCSSWTPLPPTEGWWSSMMVRCHVTNDQSAQPFFFGTYTVVAIRVKAVGGFIIWHNIQNIFWKKMKETINQNFLLVELIRTYLWLVVVFEFRPISVKVMKHGIQ